MKIFEKIITMVINIEFNITALVTDFQSCKEICDGLSGYIQGSSHAKPILIKIKTSPDTFFGVKSFDIKTYLPKNF